MEEVGHPITTSIGFRLPADRPGYPACKPAARSCTACAVSNTVVPPTSVRSRPWLSHCRDETSTAHSSAVIPQLTICLLHRKRSAGPIVSTNIKAVTGPTPGCSIKQRTSERCSAALVTARSNSTNMGSNLSSISSNSCRRCPAHGSNASDSSSLEGSKSKT
jgi:hypothetical protein